MITYAYTYVLCTTVDINECEGYNDCHQICTNTEGSYYCSCDTGFVLTADNRTCQGYYSNYIYCMYIICTTMHLISYSIISVL